MPPPIRANASTQRGCLATCGVLVFDSLSRASSSSSSSRPASFTQLVTHNFVTHNLLPTTLSHTHTTCHTQLVTRNFVTHNLSPTTLSHTTCHPQLCHTQLVTHNLSPTTLSHTTCHPQLCHTQLVTHNLSPTTLSHTTLCHTQLVTWQAWHLATTTFVLRGRRCTWQQLVTHNFVTHNLSHTTCHPQLCHTQLVTWQASTCVFPWQAWHLATCAFVSRGRRGTWRHLPAFYVAGVALMALGLLRSLQESRASAGRDQRSCHGVWRSARRNVSSHNANDRLETWLGWCFRCVDSMVSGNCERCVLQNRASTMDWRARGGIAEYAPYCCRRSSQEKNAAGRLSWLQW